MKCQQLSCCWHFFNASTGTTKTCATLSLPISRHYFFDQTNEKALWPWSRPKGFFVFVRLSAPDDCWR